MRRSVCRGSLIALISALALPAFAAGPEVERLPAEFVHDQIWLVPKVQGRELRFFTDTGGGWNAISQKAVARLGLTGETIDVDGKPATLVEFPTFDSGQGLPAAPLHFMEGRLMVTDSAQLHADRDGFLGGRWFADGIWDFDYPRQRLSKLASAPSAGTPVPLGFQINAKGERSTHFPSIAVQVDGETLDMLFDTGATATLTEESGPVFGLPAGTPIGTSFIEKEVFDRWVAKHPDWRVLERADDKGDLPRRMIEVPGIVIAGHRTGPVWFAEQPPGAFQRYMASMMYFRVVVDYPAATAWFEPAAKDR